MTLDELIGARLVVGFQGTEATDALIAQLRALHAHSLILFERNFVSPEQLIAMLRRLEEALGRRLLVMVDHEGGRVIRFRRGVTQFPDALRLAQTKQPGDIERQGAIEAQELKRLGVRVNLVPCVDVLAEGCDPVIGDRSYGSDPARVSEFAIARIRGLQAQGVAACAKHFPGLGSVGRDPHKFLPTISLSQPTMETVHWPPFRAAIEAGVATIMSSHVCYPALGDPPGLPATFSPRLIREWLRHTMGFAGVILTDDLEMGALREFGGIGEAALHATEAGHDMLLICSDLAAAEEALSALRQAYQDGRLAHAELETSVERIGRLRKNFLV